MIPVKFGWRIDVYENSEILGLPIPIFDDIQCLKYKKPNSGPFSMVIKTKNHRPTPREREMALSYSIMKVIRDGCRSKVSGGLPTISVPWL